MNKKNTNRRSPKRHSSCKKKKPHRIRNWREYNAALVQRGSFTVWIDEAALSGWCNTRRSGGRGASRLYSDAAITAALLLKVVYRLPLRATQGLLTSLLQVLGLSLPVPHYSTLSRRQAVLEVAVSEQTGAEAIHLVVDSTGCKVYGEGEWKVRQHGWGKRRTWRKLHLGVDEASGEIVAAVLSTNNMGDGEVLPDLLAQVEQPICQISGDGSYDCGDCYEALQQRQEEQKQALQVVIPPRRGARIWQRKKDTAEALPRDENLRRIRQVGRRKWKEESGYHRRSLAENTMFRLKSLFGEKLWAREFPRQAKEAFLRCAALNRMTALGMPDSYAV